MVAIPDVDGGVGVGGEGVGTSKSHEEHCIALASHQPASNGVGVGGFGVGAGVGVGNTGVGAGLVGPGVGEDDVVGRTTTLKSVQCTSVELDPSLRITTSVPP